MDAPEQIARQEYLARAADAEDFLRSQPGAATSEADLDLLCPVSHSFADGQYIRELNCPAGVMAVTKLHRKSHPFFLLEGEVTVLTSAGVERLRAPYFGITPAGTKRVVYTHTATRWVTVHATKKTDLGAIENEVIAGEAGVTAEEIEKLLEAN